MYLDELHTHLCHSKPSHPTRLQPANIMSTGLFGSKISAIPAAEFEYGTPMTHAQIGDMQTELSGVAVTLQEIRTQLSRVEELMLEHMLPSSTVPLTEGLLDELTRLHERGDPAMPSASSVAPSTEDGVDDSAFTSLLLSSGLLDEQQQADLGAIESDSPVQQEPQQAPEAQQAQQAQPAPPAETVPPAVASDILFEWGGVEIRPGVARADLELMTVAALRSCLEVLEITPPARARKINLVELVFDATRA